MKALVMGATGYVGSAVARNFQSKRYETHGLARSAANRTVLERAGVTPIDGDYRNPGDLGRMAAQYDVVVFAAMMPFEAEPDILRPLLEAMRGRQRHFLFTSGTGVLSIEAKDGRWNDFTSAEDEPFPFPERYNRAHRIKTEGLVRNAARDGLRTTVIRPPLIYGRGGSIHVPQIFESARKTGAACYLGQGLNLYSNVHVDDLAEVYSLAVEKGTPGALYHAVAGEANFRSIAEAVASVVGCGTRSLTYEDACDLWGTFWVDLALAVNSRSMSPRTRAELGWAPKHIDLIEDIRGGSYRAKYQQDLQTGISEYSWKSHG